MTSDTTKEPQNRYYQARLRAAKYNESLLTRPGAVKSLPGVTEESLKNYELDLVRTPNTVVVLMAEAYGQPELRNWYCANECPIGRDRICEINDMPPERTAIRMLKQLDTMKDGLDELMDILEDGIVTEEEMQRIPSIKTKFLEARKRADEILAAIEKIETRDDYRDRRR